MCIHYGGVLVPPAISARLLPYKFLVFIYARELPFLYVVDVDYRKIQQKFKSLVMKQSVRGKFSLHIDLNFVVSRIVAQE